ncbi:MAG: potassium channel family protein, partial [Desulfobacterales bacterium]|nr:potassium channel family protein [Desulfobacterales bacterium]
MAVKKNIDSGIYTSGAKLIRGLVLLLGVLAAATMGYMIIEGWRFLDALYMTVITITTVGYGEIRAVSEPGRVFTIFVIFLGMGIMAYTVGMVAQVMIELQISSILGRRKLGSRIKSIKNHYIICGYGRIGRIIAQELKSSKANLIVIDDNPDMKHDLERHEIAYIIDNATDEDVLVEAHIERAKGLVAVVSSDADNLFITMTARGLNKELHILARA